MKRSISTQPVVSKIQKVENEKSSSQKLSQYHEEIEEIKKKYSQESPEIDLFVEQEDDGFINSDEHVGESESESCGEEDKLEMEESFSNLIEEIMEIKGISELYSWQSEFLKLFASAPKSNFLVSVPTSGGKSLIAEATLLNALLQGGVCILVVPYISLVEEYKLSFSKHQEIIDFELECLYSNSGAMLDSVSSVLYICTIEKANLLMHHLLLNRIEISHCVVDEFHLIGEMDRGEALEIFLTKLLLKSIPILGISATFPNLKVFAEWLKAKLYVSDYRPVDLNEYFKFGNSVFTWQRGEFLKLRELDPKVDSVIELCSEVVPKESCLVFCATKKQCELTAVQLAKDEKLKSLWDLGEVAVVIAEVQSQLEDESLKKLIGRRVAYHHSGLTKADRALIEFAFKNRFIVILCCTSTLAAGVNLPAKRVIFKTPYIAGDLLLNSKYRQMAGRAGRKGLDSYGESFLCGKREEASAIISTRDQMSSRMTEKGIQRLIIDTISLGIDYTLLKEHLFVEYDLSSIILKLVEHNFLGRSGKVTKFGEATIRSGFSISDANFIYSELLKVHSEGVILADSLHICYFIAPCVEEVNWTTLMQILGTFKGERSYIIKRIGICEDYIVQRALNRSWSNDAPDEYTEKKIKKLWNAILFCDNLIQHISKGGMENLLEMTTMYGNMVVKFCDICEWKYFALLTRTFMNDCLKVQQSGVHSGEN